MRRPVSSSLGWLFLVMLAGTTGSITWADSPSAACGGRPAATPDSSLPDDPDGVLERGLNQERSRNWTAAIETYHDALERWPSRADFSRRLRLCEIHFKLNRRYSDTQFPQCPAALAPGTGRRSLRRGARAHPDQLCRSGAVRAAGPPRARQPRGRPARSGLRQGQRTGGHARARHLAARDAQAVSRDRSSIPDRSAAVRMALTSCELARQAIGMAVDARLAGIHLRRLRRARRFHELPDPRQARRPLRHDRRQLRRSGDRAEDRQGGSSPGRRDSRRPGVGGRLKAGELIVAVDGQPIKGLSLDEAANRLQGTEGTTVEIDVSDGATARPGAIAWSAATSTSKASPTSSSSTRPTGSAISSSRAFRKPPPRRSTGPSSTLSGAGHAGPGARSPGQPRRPAQRGRRDRRAVHRPGPDRLHPRPSPGPDPVASAQRPGQVADAPVRPGRPRQRQRQRNPGRRPPGPPAAPRSSARGPTAKARSRASSRSGRPPPGSS